MLLKHTQVNALFHSNRSNFIFIISFTPLSLSLSIAHPTLCSF